MASELLTNSVESTATQKTVIQTFRAVVNHAVSAGYRDAGITIPKLSAKAPQKRVMSPEEVMALIHSSREVVSEEYSRLITTLYLSGMRIGEAVAIRSTDIDLEAGTITIARRYYENVEESGQWDVPKNGKVQSIPIHPELLQVLTVQMVNCDNKGVSELLFSNEDGSVLSPRTVRELMKKVANIALDDATGVTPHALRRSIASTLVDSNLPIDSVADYMRHGTQVLQNHYNKPNRKLFRSNFSGLKLIVNGDN
jgi:integrase